jgi:hypothetical protein
MQDIQPHFRWRDKYESSRDPKSPFAGRQYSEFQYSQKIYNYFIHPQWDNFGSPTLYMKIIFVDYDKGVAIFEFIGEWNDAVTNDIMFLKRDVVDEMTKYGIFKYILLCDNVLNFHGEDDDYYEEWWDDVKEDEGYIVMLNLLEHVQQEVKDTRLHQYLNFGGIFNDVNWQALKPKLLIELVEKLHNEGLKYLGD